MTSLQMLKKASVKTLYGDKEAILEAVMKNKETPVFMFSIEGTAVGTRHGEKDQGDKVSEWTALIGEFVCVSGATGEVFATGECFLPNYLTNMIAGKLGGEGIKGVPVNADVFASYDKSAATLYVFEGTLHGLELPDERIKALVDRAASAKAPLALAAPAKDGKGKSA